MYLFHYQSIWRGGMFKSMISPDKDKIYGNKKDVGRKYRLKIVYRSSWCRLFSTIECENIDDAQ